MRQKTIISDEEIDRLDDLYVKSLKKKEGEKSQSQ